jgi:Ni2+-binding GTPase involved in maturation of urease and hydrogenase
MRLITVSGPPSSGKTSVILHVIQAFHGKGVRAGVVKFDCLTTDDGKIYQQRGVPVQVGLSGSLCPDHFFVCNIESCMDWAARECLDVLITESAGLCNRCSPHIKDMKALCVIDNLMGVNTPKKVGPMLKMADVAAITKGDVVSQAEREVFAFRVRQANARGHIMNVNGITGQGCPELASLLWEDRPSGASAGDETGGVPLMKLRFNMPAALCSYCLGETQIGQEFLMGNARKMVFK